MRIVSWNCNGRFRDKYEQIQKLDADIYIIQECENPKNNLTKAYLSFAKEYCWCGEYEFKGLGVFSNKGLSIHENLWKKYCLRNFLSVNINNLFNIVAVWAGSPYIEEYYLYQCINKENYDKKTIVIGDFNSNHIWDKQYGKRNHQIVVNELEDIGLYSAYHYVTKEEQGKETQSTFFMNRNLDKQYHIDHCFIDKDRIINYYIVEDKKEWLQFSDHLPIVLEI